MAMENISRILLRSSLSEFKNGNPLGRDKENRNRSLKLTSKQSRVMPIPLQSPSPTVIESTKAIIEANPIILEPKSIPILSKEHKVEFANVTIRSYELILGDNPDIEVPLSLGWKYHESSPVRVDIFERDQNRHHPPNRTSEYPKGKKGQEPKFLNLHARRLRLKAAGYSAHRILSEERRRRVQLTLEWAYRNNREETAMLCACPRATTLVTRYIV